jgi:transcriptional regulator GlxA family with amidase domain
LRRLGPSDRIIQPHADSEVKMNPKAQFAISFLRMNLHRVVVIGELAELVKLSRSRLCYLFKAELGLSPSQYLKMLRMERSRELL